MSENTYTIRDLSTRYNLPPSTLRYYEEMGLLENVIHTETGARIYNDWHIARLEGILCFKRTNLPIAKIQEYYRYETNMEAHIDDIVDMMNDQEQDIIRQLKDLQDGLDHIRDKIYYYELVKDALAKGEQFPSWDEIFCHGTKTRPADWQSPYTKATQN